MTVTTTTTFRLGLEGNLEGTKSVVPAVEGFSAVFSCFGGRSFKGMNSFSEDAIYKFSEMGGSPSTVAMYGVVYFQYDHEAKWNKTVIPYASANHQLRLEKTFDPNYVESNLSGESQFQGQKKVVTLKTSDFV